MHVAQIRAVARQAPLFYGVIAIEALLLVFTHRQTTPPWLSYLPAFGVVVLCLVRAVHYYRIGQREVGPDEAYRHLVILNRNFRVVIGGLAIWGMLLDGYGDASVRFYTMFFVTTGIMICVFGLMHIRSCALSGAAMIPFVAAYYAFGSNEAIRTMMVTYLVYGGAMVFLVFVYHNAFLSLVNQHNQLTRLGSENLKLANLDLLTGLPNRRNFFSNLDDAVLAWSRQRGRLHVGLIDLDGFKRINDTFGHPAGDAVLREVGERLQRVVDDRIFAARLGGDEFGLILRDIDPEALSDLGKQVCVALTFPYATQVGAVQIGASIGFASADKPAEMTSGLVEKADFALYHAKSAERGGTVLFTPELAGQLNQREVIEQTLRQADLERELHVAFQPMVHVGSGRPKAFEALAGWTSPTLGRVPPSDFITVAEGTDLMFRLTDTLLTKALSAVAAWPEDVRVSFNLSAHDLARAQVVEHIALIIRDSGVAPERIVFEVTETGVIRDFEKAKGVLDELKALGTAIALDDFGTGFSSLSYVHRLPIDKLKIDRAFVVEMEEEQTCRHIIHAVVALCRTLDIDCVAEGVETAEQVLLLRSLGCDIMQGYYFRRPMPEAEVLDYLSSFEGGDEAVDPSQRAA